MTRYFYDGRVSFYRVREGLVHIWHITESEWSFCGPDVTFSGLEFCTEINPLKIKEYSDCIKGFRGSKHMLECSIINERMYEKILRDV